MSKMESKHHPEAERKAMTVRLRKIVGQLKSIEQMLDDDRDCPEILMQLVSARKGLKSFAEKLIHQHLHFCIEGARQEQGKKRMQDLLHVLDRYVE